MNEKLKKSSELLKLEADMCLGLAKRLDKLAEIEEGEIILIDNMSRLKPCVTRIGVFDETFLGYYKESSDTIPVMKDFGINIQFKEKAKILEFGGKKYGLPSIDSDKEFYEKAKARFVDNEAMKAAVHYNSLLLSGKNIVNSRLKFYKTSLEEAGF